jgi:Tat protein translocase TatB subunit
MFGIGTGEILLLLIIALIVLGPERMPKLARDLGRAVAEFRRTRDELRSEFLNADKYLEAPATPAAVEPPTPATETLALPSATEPASTTDADREAREARERLRDPARMEQAKAEGWKTPTDEAGTSERWG